MVNANTTQKLTSLRVEADAALQRAEEAEKKNKALEQALLERDQEIKSKDHKLDALEVKVEDISAKLKDTTEKCVARSDDTCHSIEIIYADYGP